VEREEEYLTNTLQKQLKKLEQEKIAMELKVEIEEDFIVNKLQKQLEALMEEKRHLEDQLGSESLVELELRKNKKRHTRN